MRTVHKYVIKDDEGIQVIELPRSAIFLHMQYVRQVLCIWFEVITEGPPGPRFFLPLGTGDDLDAQSQGMPMRHLASTLRWDDTTIVHLFAEHAVWMKHERADQVRQAYVEMLVRVESAKRKLDRAIIEQVPDDALRPIYHEYIEALAVMRGIEP